MPVPVLLLLLLVVVDPLLPLALLALELDAPPFPNAPTHSFPLKQSSGNVLQDKEPRPTRPEARIR
jgi:hypothetical protein